MAISRPFLLALLGAALLAVTGLVVHNARSSSADDSTPAAQQPAQQATQPAAQQATPDQTLEAAFSSAKLKSATFAAKLDFNFRHRTGGIALNGAFESTGSHSVPKAAVQLRVQA